MGFSEVQSLDADVTVALGKKDKAGKPYPKQVEGYYLGLRKVQNKRGESSLHFLKTANGNLGVWGTTDLDRKLNQVQVGTMIKVTSTGTKPTPNGEMYTYLVEQDKANTIEVEAPSYNAAASESDADTTSEPEYTDTDDADDEDMAQTVALQAAERQAKVQALLARGKTKSK